MKFCIIRQVPPGEEFPEGFPLNVRHLDTDPFLRCCSLTGSWGQSIVFSSFSKSDHIVCPGYKRRRRRLGQHRCLKVPFCLISHFFSFLLHLVKSSFKCSLLQKWFGNRCICKGVAAALKVHEAKRQEHIYEFIITEKHHCQLLKVIRPQELEGSFKLLKYSNPGDPTSLL